MVGVKVELLIWGIMCLRNDLLFLYGNIMVYLIVGCFLEYLWIYYFEVNGYLEIYLVLVDMMIRNFNWWVEEFFLVI